MVENKYNFLTICLTYEQVLSFGDLFNCVQTFRQHIMISTNIAFYFILENQEKNINYFCTFSVDDRSMAFLRAYGDAAREIDNTTKTRPLKRVDCSDWMDVCQEQNITVYPTLKIYSGKHIDDYKGHYGTQQVVRLVQM